MSVMNRAEMERYVLEHFDEALERHYIKPYLQPVVRTLSRRLCGFEALTRWESPDLGLLLPDKFIGVLERNRRIHELDAYIIREICAGYRDAMTDGAFLPISVNLSRLDYELCDIFEVVESAVRANKVPRSHLCVEITESMLNSNESLMRQYIDRFQKAGYPVWMDDFGSGYSSLNLLKDYHFDELKIDMEFLSDFHPRSKMILASIVHMAKQIGIQTLTEGVETQEAFEFLRNIGCEKAQGSLFGPPIPYMDCLRQAKERGLSWETPMERKYFDELGHIDLLSAAPFLFGSETADPGDGREMNSIPLALVEFDGGEALFHFANKSMERILSDIHWQSFSVSGTQLLLSGKRVLVEKLSPLLKGLLTEAAESGSGTLNFVHSGEYYEVYAKRVASVGDMRGLLVQVTNLSRDTEMARQNALDDGLRQIYASYDRVSILDPEKDSTSALYMDASEEEFYFSGSLRESIRRFAMELIFPEDRERYLQFIDPDTLSERVDRSGKGCLTALFRTRTRDGSYPWRSYSLIHIRDSEYYMLVRTVEDVLRDIEKRENKDGALTADLLWGTMCRIGTMKLFWKDTERRFRGMSRSFLDYYNFDTEEELLGKTDEDVGWHVHPDDYRGAEWDVLRHGAISRERAGKCIVRGESRDIIATKMPVYNEDGRIVGLLGCFDESREETGSRGRNVSVDALTGLLNSRGLDESSSAYQDEYELRHTDFGRIDVSIEELSDINRRYGHDFGDRVVCAVANELVRCCGTTATVGRATGSQFTVLCQFEDRSTLDALTARIRSISSTLREVDGIPFTAYLFVGVSVYSEAESMEEQTFLAQLRRMTDDAENVPKKQLRENLARVFRLYEDLPIAYSVFKLLPGAKREDALVLYTNRALRELLHREDLVGGRVRRLFPQADRKWFELARRSALDGERVVLPLDGAYLTVNRVIGPGYCAFSYLKT